MFPTPKVPGLRDWWGERPVNNPACWGCVPLLCLSEDSLGGRRSSWAGLLNLGGSRTGLLNSVRRCLSRRVKPSLPPRAAAAFGVEGRGGASSLPACGVCHPASGAEARSFLIPRLHLGEQPQHTVLGHWGE